jgi:hypothetical protein
MRYSKNNKESIFNEICLRVSDGESLVSVCKSLNNKPDRATVYRWMMDNEEMCNRYTRAMELRALLFVDEILEISDETSNDTLTIQKGKQVIEVENREWVNRSRLRVDSRKWIASKLFPKQFGDKVEDKNKEIGDNEIIIRRV